MSYRDRCDPMNAHVVRISGVELRFGEGGLLKNPNAEQLAAMRANPVRAHRFAEVADPKPPPPPDPVQTSAKTTEERPGRGAAARPKNDPERTDA